MKRRQFTPHYFLKNLFVIIFLLSFCMLFALNSCSNEKTAEQKWISIFNGKDLTGWKIKITGHELNNNYLNTFQVRDGKLIVSYDKYESFNGEFGHIFYDKKFSNYIMRIEYRFIGDQVPGGPGWAYRNSGIMFHCQSPESMLKDQDFPVSVEAQLLGGNGTDERSTANVCTPGTHFVMDGQLITDHCVSSRSKTFHGDQWVTMELEVHGNTAIKHRVNGESVMEYEKPQLDENDEDAQKLIQQGQAIMLSEGFISLQAESHPMEYRKVEILELKGN